MFCLILRRIIQNFRCTLTYINYTYSDILFKQITRYINLVHSGQGVFSLYTGQINVYYLGQLGSMINTYYTYYLQGSPPKLYIMRL